MAFYLDFVGQQPVFSSLLMLMEEGIKSAKKAIPKIRELMARYERP